MTVLTSWVAMFIPWGSHGYGPALTDELGLCEAPGDGRLYQVSEGGNGWHRVIGYWHMQISGMSIMIPLSDFEAREFDLDTLPAHLRPASLDELNVTAWYREIGWPLPALTCSVHWKKQVSNADVIYTVKGGVQLPRDSAYDPRVLPLVPVWPGCIINVILFGGAWLGLTSFARAARRGRRERAGLCVHCGYPRTGLRPYSPCPECGRR